MFNNFGEGIRTYVINLKKRTDRLSSVLSEFADKPEFKLTIVDAVEHEIGAIGLWHSILEILRRPEVDNQEYIIICEDDHEFSPNYERDTFYENILRAAKLDADILSGGVSSVKNVIPLSQSLLWTENFSGFQFTVIFPRLFKVILDAKFENYDRPDHKICMLSSIKLVVYPFISQQKEFGYSDVTRGNEVPGRIRGLFQASSDTISSILDVKAFYSTLNKTVPQIDEINFDHFTIPTFIINLPKRSDRRFHITREFAGKSEFDVTLIEAFEHRIGAVGLWLTIRKIIDIAIKNNDDLIIICEDDHQFTECYSKHLLFQNIIEAHHQGADVLSGGIGGGFNQAVKISENRFWINHFYCTQFIVVYSKFFQSILDEPFDEKVTADDFISELTSNKMVIFPFISVQKDFGYSDATINNNKIPGKISEIFTIGSQRLELTKSLTEKFDDHFLS